MKGTGQRRLHRFTVFFVDFEQVLCIALVPFRFLSRQTESSNPASGKYKFFRETCNSIDLPILSLDKVNCFSKMLIALLINRIFFVKELDKRIRGGLRKLCEREFQLYLSTASNYFSLIGF